MTRVKQGVQAGRVYSATVDRTSGVICDQTIYLTCFYASKGTASIFSAASTDPVSGKMLVFWTNNMAMWPLWDVHKKARYAGLLECVKPESLT